jgi:hypothetical protein
VDSTTQHGYLVLADISGYTAYLAGTELEHAHEILTALLETIVEKFKTLLTISKLEGDAVFAYVPEVKLPRGETLLELIESTYVAFRDHVENAHRRTICECNACRAIPTLDLKFMVHHGDYILQHVAGITELVGSDVNLAHRLMKNHVAEATGWHAYALFTEVGLKHMALQPEGMHEQAETYEHLGEVKTFNLNMRQRYQELKETQRVFVTAAEADVIMMHDFPAPPPVVWDWVNEPNRRVQWSDFDTFQVVRRPDGRTGAGARMHCVHDKKTINSEAILDWRPFDYFTHEASSGPMLMTFQFEPINDGQGTRVYVRMKGKMPLPDFIRKPLLKFMMRMYKVEDLYRKLETLIAREQAELERKEGTPE